jgi:hypothetical protein
VSTQEALRLADTLDSDYDPDWWLEIGCDQVVAALRTQSAEIDRFKADKAELLEVLERIADPRNKHFAGDAQVVAREAINKHKD